MSEKARPIDILLPLYEQDKLTHVLPSAYKADGMIFAVAASPEIPMPEQWMPWLIQHGSSVLVDKDVDLLADTLINNLRSHLQRMQDGTPALPIDCSFRDAQLTIPNALSEWLSGLLVVHQHLEHVWQDAWNKSCATDKQHEGGDSAEKRLTRCLKLFSTLANVELAVKGRSDGQAQQLLENVPLLWKQLPTILNDYISLSGELAEALPNQFETFTKSL